MSDFIFKLTLKRWIGRWVMMVALIHTIFTFVIFPDLMAQVMEMGVYNSVNAETAAGVWFFFFGPPLFLVGILIDWAEKSDNSALPPLLTVGLFFITLLGIFMMPDSGFYLMIPALIGLQFKNRADHQSEDWSHT